MKRIFLIASLVLVNISSSYVFGSALEEENATKTGKTKWLNKLETLTQRMESDEGMTRELYEELRRAETIITSLGLSNRTIAQVAREEESLRAHQRVIDLKFALLQEERRVINLTARLRQAESIRIQQARDPIEEEYSGDY